MTRPPRGGDEARSVGAAFLHPPGPQTGGAEGPDVG